MAGTTYYYVVPGSKQWRRTAAVVYGILLDCGAGGQQRSIMAPQASYQVYYPYNTLLFTRYY